jgi:hypothetical protein
LTRYYQAPREVARLQRQREGLERRIAYLTTELDGRAAPLSDSTVPGTVARYDGPVGTAGGVGNPTLAMVLRLEACETKAAAELRERHAELFDLERALSDLENLRALLHDVVSQLDPGDRELLELYHRDGWTFERIAYRAESGYADESGPRKRLARLEADIARALWPEPLAVVRER